MLQDVIVERIQTILISSSIKTKRYQLLNNKYTLIVQYVNMFSIYLSESTIATKVQITIIHHYKKVKTYQNMRMKYLFNLFDSSDRHVQKGNWYWLFIEHHAFCLSICIDLRPQECSTCTRKPFDDTCQNSQLQRAPVNAFMNTDCENKSLCYENNFCLINVYQYDSGWKNLNSIDSLIVTLKPKTVHRIHPPDSIERQKQY